MSKVVLIVCLVKMFGCNHFLNLIYFHQHHVELSKYLNLLLFLNRASDVISNLKDFIGSENEKLFFLGRSKRKKFVQSFSRFFFIVIFFSSSFAYLQSNVETLFRCHNDISIRLFGSQTFIPTSCHYHPCRNKIYLLHQVIWLRWTSIC